MRLKPKIYISCDRLLLTFFCPYFAHMPHYSADALQYLVNQLITHVLLAPLEGGLGPGERPMTPLQDGFLEASLGFPTSPDDSQSSTSDNDENSTKPHALVNEKFLALLVPEEASEVLDSSIEVAPARKKVSSLPLVPEDALERALMAELGLSSLSAAAAHQDRI